MLQERNGHSARSWVRSAAAPDGDMRTGQVQLYDMDRAVRDSRIELYGGVCVDGVVVSFAAHVCEAERSRKVFNLSEEYLS